MLWDACDGMELTSDECNILPTNGDLRGNALSVVLDGNKVIILRSPAIDSAGL